jgi:hypothetical protein
MKIRGHQVNLVRQPDCPDLIHRPVIRNRKAVVVSVRIELMPMLNQQAVKLFVLRWNNLVSQVCANWSNCA